MDPMQKTLDSCILFDIKDKELLNFLVGREGGKTSILILDLIIEKPYNKNQLANKLGLDYNTINYHIKLMCAHDYVTAEKFEKIVYYYPSEKFYNSKKEYNLLKKYVLSRSK